MVETKTNSGYLIGLLDKVIRPLVLILIKMSWYVKAFQFKDRSKDKINKLKNLDNLKQNKLEKLFGL